VEARLQHDTRTAGVRADFVPADHYTSRDFLRGEQALMWPRVWQVACREEELPRVGAYVTYEIMDETIVVVRVSETGIKAYYNVCQHRGRRLMDGCGQTARFHCRFHGWQWNLDGSLARVLDREDWAGCPDFADEDLRLKELRIGTWAGFVFVNMDPEAEPLETFLAPVPHYLNPYEIGRMRYRWYVSARLPCNWKVAVEAFNEGYHVAGTHPQLLAGQGDDRTSTRIFGRHGMFGNHPEPRAPFGAPSPRTGQPPPADLRQGVIDYLDIINTTLKAIYSERDVEASRRLLSEVDAEAAPMEIMLRLLDFQREAAIASGAGWPDITVQQLFEAGIDWHIFPNLVILPYPDAALAYRALPDPKDPGFCIFDIYSLQRYAPGAEPEVTRQVFHGEDDWRRLGEVSEILAQDFSNMGEVQRGVKSRGFAGARTSPVQEATVSNFHRVICDYLDQPDT
jgi:nitrite reductase/ring-hydroxylating ferredoxin subunit